MSVLSSIAAAWTPGQAEKGATYNFSGRDHCDCRKHQEGHPEAEPRGSTESFHLACFLIDIHVGFASIEKKLSFRVLIFDQNLRVHFIFDLVHRRWGMPGRAAGPPETRTECTVFC